MGQHKLAFSGWMASGKDTVALEAMRRLGEQEPVRLSFADPIRDEVADLLRLLREGCGDDSIAAAMNCRPEQVAVVRGHLEGDLQSGVELHPRSRTESMRRTLQVWGTDVRRAQDPDHWVRASLKEADRNLQQGRSVYYTDMRFPNEVEALRKAGFHTIRIRISRSTQAERLAGRDQLAHRADALLHPSETALDDYQNFHQIVENDGELDRCIDQILRNYPTEHEL